MAQEKETDLDPEKVKRKHVLLSSINSSHIFPGRVSSLLCFWFFHHADSLPTPSDENHALIGLLVLDTSHFYFGPRSYNYSKELIRRNQIFEIRGDEHHLLLRKSWDAPSRLAQTPIPTPLFLKCFVKPAQPMIQPAEPGAFQPRCQPLK